MSRRIWFTQQKLFEYMPLRAGLGLITEAEFQEWQDKKNENAYTCVGYPCPKIFTTRTHRLSGEYVVVEGSRFKAKPVIPEIRFRVNISEELDLRRGVFKKNNTIVGWAIANRDIWSFPELDLGYQGATFEELTNELLSLNKDATIDTPFFVNLLEPVQEATA